MMFLHVLAVLSAILVRSVSGDAAPEQQVLAANTSKKTIKGTFCTLFWDSPRQNYARLQELLY